MQEKIIHRLFLIDGLGALVSAIMLGVVLPLVQPLVGIPLYTLYLLAVFPILFAIIDFYALFKKPSPIQQYLKIIAACNITYCFLSVAMAYYHRSQITVLGWIYLIIEVIIVGTLALIELNYAKKHQN